MSKARDIANLSTVEIGADVTDTDNVTSAGALMDTEITNLADVKSFDPADYATAAQGTLADSALQSIPDNYILNTGDSITGNLSFGDNDKAIFGAGSDLQIYHDVGGNSFITETGTGNLRIQGSNLRLQTAAGTADYLSANEGAEVSLSYNNSPKLATTSTGIDVTGTATMDGLTVESGSTLIATFEAPTVAIELQETDTTDQNTRLIQGTSAFYVQTVDDASSSTTSRFKVDHTTGDISFYDTAGTNVKFHWSAADERLGIGTSSPAAPLDIKLNTNSTADIFKFQRLDGAVAGVLNYSGTDGAISLGTTTSHDLTFDTNGTERMRIDASGNVGIGVDPETNKFRVTQSGVTQLILGYQGTSTNYYDADTHILRAGGGSEHMRIDSSGTLVLAATSPGIQFGGVGTPTAPVTSKTLDDYEEGTWTPTAVWGSGSAATITGDTYTGGYTKVGSQVHAFARITYTSKSGGSGDVYFNNLPFAIDTSVIDPVGAYVATAHNVNLGATKRYAGTTAFSVLVQPSQGSAWRWTTIGDFPASGGDIYMTFSYRAA